MVKSQPQPNPFKNGLDRINIEIQNALQFFLPNMSKGTAIKLYIKKMCKQ